MLVTSYYNIYSTNSFEKYFALFKPLAESGLPIIVFTDDEHAPAFKDLPTSITLICRPLDSFEIYKIGSNYSGELPNDRNKTKDTKEFLSLMNTKPEFVKAAFEAFPDEKIMIWIDFGILKVIHNQERCIDKLKKIVSAEFTKITIPGCWSLGYPLSVDAVHWRFCGGFFIMPRHLMDEFYGHVKCVFTDFCTQPIYRLTWETNVWMLIEFCVLRDKIDWYYADHNDTIIMNAPLS
jgi:hypothetical protein